MTRFAFILIMLWPNVGLCETPVVALPVELRQENWLGADASGSCMNATTMTLLNWQLHSTEWPYEGGDWIDHTYNSRTNHAQKLDNESIPFAYITNGDSAFLDYCLATRRGAGVVVKGGRHAVTLVHLDEEIAILLDNNDVRNLIVVDRQRFLSEWNASHGWAWTIMESPSPPLPKQ